MRALKLLASWLVASVLLTPAIVKAEDNDFDRLTKNPDLLNMHSAVFILDTVFGFDRGYYVNIQSATRAPMTGDALAPVLFEKIRSCKYAAQGRGPMRYSVDFSKIKRIERECADASCGVSLLGQDGMVCYGEHGQEHCQSHMILIGAAARSMDLYAEAIRDVKDHDGCRSVPAPPPLPDRRIILEGPPPPR